MTDRYVFGDTDVAARRLGVLAECFAPSSRGFLAEVAGPGREMAADLGCGPGHTTHLLADVLRQGRVVGLDNSESFIGLAEKTATPRVSFRLHDVTATPFPTGPCDLIYGRYLLTHQTTPEPLVAKWATQLRAGGRLLVEEVEAIHTSNAAFATYLGIVDAMLTDAGHHLCVGPDLEAMPTPAGLEKCSSRVASVPVTTDVAATMFSMNIHTWKHNPFVRENYPAALLQELEATLFDLAATPTAETCIEWGLRQLGFERKT